MMYYVSIHRSLIGCRLVTTFCAQVAANQRRYTNPSGSTSSRWNASPLDVFTTGYRSEHTSMVVCFSLLFQYKLPIIQYFILINYKPSSNAPLRCVSTMSVRSCLYICQKKDKKGSVKISVQLK